MPDVEQVIPAQNELGEGPIWDQEGGVLYWVDIPGQHIHRYVSATGQYEGFPVETPVTALGLRAAGGFVAATSSGLALWDPASQELECIAHPEADRPGIRFNDGAVDSRGRFWAGTMNERNPESPDGALYRLDPDHSLHKVADGFTVSNGLGWSPDTRTMYFTDTFRHTILAYDFEASTGTLTNQRPFAVVPDEEGLPDGLTVDCEGFVWSAQCGGGTVARYDPDGKKERQVQLPVRLVTSCTFGGRELDKLFITSAWMTLSSEDRRAQPLAGDLFRVKTDIRGLAESRFAG
jgi:sugar lactone lactonase YvrE